MGSPIFYFRMWRVKRRLRKDLKREPTFGDIYADALGYRVEDQEFQDAINQALGDLGE